MRKVLSLSLNNNTITKVKRQAKTLGFGNTSEYLRHLIESQEDLISEEELVEAAKQAEEEYRTGRTIKAGSMADLL